MGDFDMGSLKQQKGQGPPLGKQTQPASSQDEIVAAKKEMQKMILGAEKHWMERFEALERNVKARMEETPKTNFSPLGIEQLKVYVMERMTWCKKNKRKHELARLEGMVSMMEWSKKPDG